MRCFDEKNCARGFHKILQKAETEIYHNQFMHAMFWREKLRANFHMYNIQPIFLHLRCFDEKTWARGFDKILLKVETEIGHNQFMHAMFWREKLRANSYMRCFDEKNCARGYDKLLQKVETKIDHNQLMPAMISREKLRARIFICTIFQKAETGITIINK